TICSTSVCMENNSRQIVDGAAILGAGEPNRQQCSTKLRVGTDFFSRHEPGEARTCPQLSAVGGLQKVEFHHRFRPDFFLKFPLDSPIYKVSGVNAMKR
ncbi:MAG: hypothetical protein ACRCR1_05155, partial [Aeromonas sp.]